MLGLDNPLHIAFILVLLLLVFGAKRLPEMGKSLGQGLRGFKDSISAPEPTANLSEAHIHDAVRVEEPRTAHVGTDATVATATPDHTPVA
jgi:sec-independent protein translocase protein TatA